MKKSAIELKIDFEKIKPAAKRIMECMGYRNGKNHELIMSNTEDLITESMNHADAVGGYRLFEENSITVESGKMLVNNEVFELDKIIAKQLTKCTSVAFLVVTLGMKYDDWINQYFKQGDPFLGYIADTIGSEMVENAADVIESMIDEEADHLAMKSTNRYSPGYCGWHVFEQHKFFALLPDNYCGIELSESALMKPVKSVSAIIGIGKKLFKERLPMLPVFHG